MSKQIQISVELFLDLCKYHIGDMKDPDREERIINELTDKLDRAAARERYTQSLIERSKTES